jgi:uncharacterized membrane protein YhaH (DUF805 family)
MSGLLLNALAILILGHQFLALALKRDRQEKYVMWPLLLTPLVIIYVIVWPAVSAGKGLEMSNFLMQVLAYQGLAAILSLFCKQEGQLGQAGFWLPAMMNIGSAVGLFFYARG